MQLGLENAPERKRGRQCPQFDGSRSLPEHTTLLSANVTEARWGWTRGRIGWSHVGLRYDGLELRRNSFKESEARIALWKVQGSYLRFLRYGESKMPFNVRRPGRKKNPAKPRGRQSLQKPRGVISPRVRKVGGEHFAAMKTPQSCYHRDD